MKKNLYILIIILILFLIDRVSKILALSLLQDGLFCCKKFLGLQLFHNSGIAFGLPLPIIISLVVSIIIIIALITILIKKHVQLSSLSLFAGELIVIGAISNLLDRIYHHQIIDFIILGKWPIFNLADVFIIIGILLIIVQEFRKPTRQS